MTSTATQVQQFVNLNKTRTYVPGPDGQQVLIMPFDESLEPATRRADAVYVVQGEWWAQFVGEAGPLFRFPAPREYGRESFPVLGGRNVRAITPRVVGSVDPGTTSDDDGSEGGDEEAQVSALAGLGRPRVTGDVITPEGFIRRTNPRTGEEELVEDIPANRAMTHTKTLEERARSGEAVPSEDPNAPLKRSIVDELERLGVDSYRQFAELSDEVLLRIPGVNQQNLTLLRSNMGDLLKRMDEEHRADAEAETPVGESADGREHDLGLDTGDETPDPDVDPEHEDGARERIEAATKRKKATKRGGKKKATAKKKAKTQRRKPATD